MQTTAVPNTLYPNLDHHVQEIIEQGYTVVPNVLSSDEVREINEIIDAIFDKEKTIADERNWHNATFRVAYMLPQKHPLFRTLPFNPRVLPLMQAVLGNRCILSSLNALTMSPGGITQKLHRDHGDPTPGVTMTINALQTLDAFTREQVQEILLRAWSATHKMVFFITHSVEEALFLATRLIVMSPSPGRISHVYDALPFSREFLDHGDARRVKSGPDFIRLREEVLAHVHHREPTHA